MSAYDFGQFVYFFFREVAVEFINCGKVITKRNLSLVFLSHFAIISQGN